VKEERGEEREKRRENFYKIYIKSVSHNTHTHTHTHKKKVEVIKG